MSWARIWRKMRFTCRAQLIMKVCGEKNLGWQIFIGLIKHRIKIRIYKFGCVIEALYLMRKLTEILCVFLLRSVP